MMQVLRAGGMALLTDHERKADDDNPRGYCEWEPAKLLPKEPQRIDEAEGKAVKVISQLLMSIPMGRESPKCKGFSSYGDADPSNVSSQVRGAEMRVGGNPRR
jgi:hypothetical protein